MKKIIITLILIAIFSARHSFAEPNIEITTIPPYYSWGMPLCGTVNVNPDSFQVAVVIFIEGLGWWTKPYYNPLYISINPDSTWCCSVTTGAIDNVATEFCVFLIPDSEIVTIPLHQGSPCINPLLYTISVANACTKRTPKTINFCNYTWWVKDAHLPVGPGSNYFSDDTTNVWLDAQDRLHLKIKKQGSNWYCSEVYLVDTLYPNSGRFIFYIEGAIGNLDSNAVLGLFTWDNDLCPYHKEFDIEFSSNLVDSMQNAQYVIQPWYIQGHRKRWSMPANVDLSTHIIEWHPDSIVFSSFKGFQNYPPLDIYKLNSWKYDTNLTLPPNPQNIRINLWLDGGLPTNANDTAIEVIISKCEFQGTVNITYNNNNESNIAVYPNPATNNITIESLQQAVIEILNIQGQLIKTIAAISNITTIDISGFARGMYFMKVKTEKEVAVNKFIKQ
ncbi:MAG: T9SS type A sorting domain-containing protein [Bacteroidetes bacterium]|nr:T9SS type A sorting domain-containing protein [Bacteroidota bacterium]